ncbi:hypothetical protein G6F58_013271 [Rhizopus delemar]|nr:hypothetical protein G6F58_013271 [Rhizopus delemar]
MGKGYAVETAPGRAAAVHGTDAGRAGTAGRVPAGGAVHAAACRWQRRSGGAGSRPPDRRAARVQARRRAGDRRDGLWHRHHPGLRQAVRAG